MMRQRRPAAPASGAGGLAAIFLAAVVLFTFTGGLMTLRRVMRESREAYERADMAHLRLDAIETRLRVLEAATVSPAATLPQATALKIEQTPHKALPADTPTIMDDDLRAKPKPKFQAEPEHNVQPNPLAALGLQAKPGVLVLVTSNGNRYMNWQTRVCYQSFLTQAAKPGSQLKGFVRLLHRSSDDELMTEVPTVRIASDHIDCDVWCTYPVADRGPALLKYLQQPDAWEYEHIMVIETDHIFVAPLITTLPPPGQGIAFPFGYIVPEYPTVTPIMKRHYTKGPPSDIPGTGNAPVLLTVADLAKVLPVWNELTAAIDADKEAVEVLGWVREMYAYSIASAVVGIKYKMNAVPNNELMVQPPADDALGKAIICHYTWGTILKDKTTDKEVWRWDKREYASGQYGDKPVAPMIPIPQPPPWSDSLVTQDNQPFSKGKYDLVMLMREHFNAAVAQINRRNNGVPAGFSTVEEAAAAAKPLKAAFDARHAIELKEAAERRKEKQAGG